MTLEIKSLKNNLPNTKRALENNRKQTLGILAKYTDNTQERKYKWPSYIHRDAHLHF